MNEYYFEIRYHRYDQKIHLQRVPGGPEHPSDFELQALQYFADLCSKEFELFIYEQMNNKLLHRIECKAKDAIKKVYNQYNIIINVDIINVDVLDI